jgi:hypothetical protein
MNPSDGSSPEGVRYPSAAGGRLLRLKTSCPRCGSRPAVRITEELAGMLRSGFVSARIGTYQCQRRGCGAIYDLSTSDSLPEG